jgi:hypothetical protein
MKKGDPVWARLTGPESKWSEATFVQYGLTEGKVRLGSGRAHQERHAKVFAHGRVHVVGFDQVKPREATA